MSRKRWRIEFHYNYRGYGVLRLCNGSVQWEGLARTGSINDHGELVNALECREWLIRARPVHTREMAMWVDAPDNGWKVRLYKGTRPTSYLIHPDGGKGGTLGCIGIQGTDALELRDMIDSVLDQQATISVFVTRG